jgi:large subunit ribosomal protein L3
MKGLIGKKLGMTQVFGEDGRRVTITVIEAGPCPVVQRKTRDRDGYEAVQLGFGAAKASRLPRPAAARFEKVGAPCCRVLREFRVDPAEEVNPGDTVKVDVLDGVGYVDITGVTKGRGFQGVMKRHRMGGGPATHGGHSKRRVGAIGQCSYPARVAKGQRMPGHMGHRRVTVQNLRVVAVRGDDNLLFVQGAVPGPAGSVVVVREALKKAGQGGKS